ncbi:MAG: FtsH protease activity modulator HflK [Burkholderiales bacterium]|nr:FtsH protease activity modulator HflK [Burkholderiales bacterium]
MALNDPQWGKRGGNNEGPPDLDQLWRKFTQKVNALLGRRGPPNRPNGGPPDIKQLGGGFGLLLILIAVIWLASGFYTIDASQRGVVLRFGQYAETTQPGLRWHLPYPIETVEKVNVSSVRTAEIGYRNNVKSKVPKEALMLTDDENIVDIQFAVQYIVTDAQEFLFNNRNPEDTVLQAAETAIREIVGKSRMDFVLYEGRTEIAAGARKLMQDILDRYKTGITISAVTMQNAQPPEQVQAAFDDAVKAGQDRERLKNEGQAYANDVIPRARGAASRLLEEAAGYEQRVVANSEGEASRFKQILVEYLAAPVVMRERLYLETMQQILANSSKVLIDQKGGGNLLYLPLDKLMQTAAAPVAGGDAANKPSSTTETLPLPADNSMRSREAFRTRDREQRQ